MPHCPKRQGEWVRALFDPNHPVPMDLRAPDGQDLEGRFDVYRNNALVGLTEVLSGTFPVTERLVGEDFFQAMASVYIRQHPPKTPILSQFGSNFSDFIGGFAPAASVPYLADVAALEQARRSAYHAADETSVSSAQLASISEGDLPGLRVALHPSARVLCSPFPIYSIWRDNVRKAMETQPAGRNSGTNHTPVDLSVGEDVLVVRPSLEVTVHLLPAGGAALLNQLQCGSSLQQAASVAMANAADGSTFDLADCLSVAVSSGVIGQINSADTNA